MIFNCKSGSSPHCDCVQSITVEKVDAFLELKIFKNNCSTMLRMHFQPIKQCLVTRKGWPLGYRLWCLTLSLSLSHWYPGSGVVLDCINAWSLHP